MRHLLSLERIIYYIQGLRICQVSNILLLQKLQLLVTPELVDKTVLLKFFARNSPIDLIAKL